MKPRHEPVRVEVRDLTKFYNRKCVLRGVNFDLNPGRITGLVGPNGSGKSTTMRLMLGLDHGSGSTTYNGMRLHDVAVPADVVGAHLGATDFSPKRTARGYLRMLAPLAGVDDKRADETLELMGLSSVAKSRVGGFSLGMSQRLGLATAMLARPRVLILDEPANGLDPQARSWQRDFLRDYRDQGNTVLIASHLLRDLQDIADDVIVIGRGEKLTQQPVSELIRGTDAVFVRSESAGALGAALAAAGVGFQMRGSDTLRAQATTCDQVSAIAFAARIRLTEIRQDEQDLESVIVDMTADEQEYQIPVHTAANTGKEQQI